jgi:hypothetical protein
MLVHAWPKPKYPKSVVKQLMYGWYANKKLWMRVKRTCSIDTRRVLIIFRHTHWPPLVFLIMGVLYFMVDGAKC